MNPQDFAAKLAAIAQFERTPDSTSLQKMPSWADDPIVITRLKGSPGECRAEQCGQSVLAQPLFQFRRHPRGFWVAQCDTCKRDPRVGRRAKRSV